MKQAYFNLKLEKFNKLYVKIVCVYLKDKNFKKILNMYFNICKPYCPYKICNSYDIINQFIKNELKALDYLLFLDKLTISNLENEDEYKQIKSKLKEEINISK